MTRAHPIVSGLATYIPGLRHYLRHDTGGTSSAEYCYGVWLKHLVLARQSGFNRVPQSVAEVGPGDSIGVGLAALLSGACRYYALDVVRYASRDANLQIFEQLVQLFRNRAALPHGGGWPPIAPYLDVNGFPSHILTEAHLAAALDEARVQSIREALLREDGDQPGGIEVQYVVPWNQIDMAKLKSVEMLYSHTVLQHVNDLRATYAAMYQWLDDDGIMSHQIDFGTSWLGNVWNRHWGYSDFTWALIKGGRSFLINREPYSTHMQLLERYGFQTICNLRLVDVTGIRRSQLAARWKHLSDDDLVCRGAFIQATKSNLDCRQA